MTGEFLGSEVRLFDYSHTAAPDYYSKHWHTIITWQCAAETLPDFVIAPGHYLRRYLVADLNELALPEESEFSEAYRLYAQEGSDPLPYVSSELKAFLVRQKGFYLEVKNGVMLVFRKDQELAGAEDIEQLFALVETFKNSCVEAQNR